MSPTISIVVPVFNESRVIGQVIADIQKAGFTHIIVVDDGSLDKTVDLLGKLPITTVRHSLNRGKGAATKTGIEAAQRLGTDIIVTMDGDGQHDPEDIPRLIKPLLDKQSDVVLGTRSHASLHMPLPRIIGNKIGNVVTWLLSGLVVADSQSGFRAYNAMAIKNLRISGDTYEYESEMIDAMHKAHLRFCEVPIAVRYTHYSLHKPHRQNFVNGLKSLYKMVWNRLL